MAKQHWNKVAIVGVGLIGGSIGLALRKRKLATAIVGVGRRTSSLAAAKRVAAITSSSKNLVVSVAGAELVIVCTPVQDIAEHVRQIAAVASPGTLITDAGSTKSAIVSQLEEAVLTDPAWKKGVHFIGSHPLAGNEKRGAQHGSADLFEERTVVVTPTNSTRAADLKTLKQFWTSLGANVMTMSAEQHDQAVAATSHLPHLLASAIAAATPDGYVTLTAGGWQDTTRIAAADPALWRQIMLANRANLLAALGQFDKRLADFRHAIEAGDGAALERLLAEAKRTRDLIGS